MAKKITKRKPVKRAAAKTAKRTVKTVKKASGAKKATKKSSSTAKRTSKRAPATRKVKTKRKPNAAFMKPLNISGELQLVIGKGPFPRTEVTKKLWAYIKKHKLQDALNKRNINPDEKLAKVFGTNRSISMFEMTKKVSKHLK